MTNEISLDIRHRITYKSDAIILVSRKYKSQTRCSQIATLLMDLILLFGNGNKQEALVYVFIIAKIPSTFHRHDGIKIYGTCTFRDRTEVPCSEKSMILAEQAMEGRSENLRRNLELLRIEEMLIFLQKILFLCMLHQFPQQCSRLLFAYAR